MEKYDSKNRDVKFSALVLDRDLTTSFTLVLPSNATLGSELWRTLAKEQIAKQHGITAASITLQWQLIVKDETSFLMDKVRSPNKYILVATVDGINEANKKKISAQQEAILDLTNSKYKVCVYSTISTSNCSTLRSTNSQF